MCGWALDMIIVCRLHNPNSSDAAKRISEIYVQDQLCKVIYFLRFVVLIITNFKVHFQLIIKCLIFSWGGLNYFMETVNVKVALAGNRTRAARVAGEHSTTEPPMLPIWAPE